MLMSRCEVAKVFRLLCTYENFFYKLSGVREILKMNHYTKDEESETVTKQVEKHGPQWEWQDLTCRY